MVGNEFLICFLELVVDRMMNLRMIDCFTCTCTENEQGERDGLFFVPLGTCTSDV